MKSPVAAALCTLLVAVSWNVVHMQVEKDCMVDIVLLVDRSGSIVDSKLGNVPENWDRVKEFLETIVQSFTIGPNATQIAMVTFNQYARVMFHLGDTKEKMLEAIERTPRPNGRTKTAAAILEAANILTGDDSRALVPKVVIAITDGNPTINIDQTLSVDDNVHTNEENEKRQKIFDEVISLAKENLHGRASATVVTLAIGKHVDHELMTAIAGKKDHTFMADDFNQLMSKVNQITEEGCSGGYKECNLDVALAVDTSGSVSDMVGAVEAMKKFLEELVNKLYSINPTVRIALINFDHEAHLLDKLNNYKKDDILKDIAMLNPTMGWTATAGALRIANQQVFTGNLEISGDRATAANVFVLVTDGLPTVMLDGTQVKEDAPAEDRNVIMDETMNEVKILKSENQAAIMSIIVEGNKGTDYDFLKNIADEGRVVDVMKYQELIDTLDDVIKGICIKAPEATPGARELDENKDSELDSLEKLLKLLKKNLDRE